MSPYTESIRLPPLLQGARPQGRRHPGQKCSVCKTPAAVKAQAEKLACILCSQQAHRTCVNLPPSLLYFLCDSCYTPALMEIPLEI